VSHEEVADLLPDLVLGLLPDALAATVEDHLAGCGDCAARYRRHLARWMTDGRPVPAASEQRPTAPLWVPVLLLAAALTGVFLLRPVEPTAVPLGPGEQARSAIAAPTLRVYAWDGAAGVSIDDGRVPPSLAVTVSSDADAVYGVDARGVARLMLAAPWHHWTDFADRGRVVAVRGAIAPGELAAPDWTERLDRAGVGYHSMELERTPE